MPRREDIAREARTWVGTPYSEINRRKHQGTDCFGLGIGVARYAGAIAPHDNEIPFYGRLPSNHIAERAGDHYLIPLGRTWNLALPGRAGLFWWREKGHGQHFAIFSEHNGALTMVQASYLDGKVVECRVNSFWRKRLVKVYGFKGIDPC